MTREEVKNRICRIMDEKFGTDYSQTPEDSSLYYGMGLDSLDFVELVWEVEEEFGVEIPDYRVEYWKTKSMSFGQFIDVVCDVLYIV